MGDSCLGVSTTCALRCQQELSDDGVEKLVLLISLVKKLLIMEREHIYRLVLWGYSPHHFSNHQNTQELTFG